MGNRTGSLQHWLSGRRLWHSATESGPGVPLYLDESGAPGGKIITVAAFSLPAAGKETWDAMHCGDSAPLSSI